MPTLPNSFQIATILRTPSTAPVPDSIEEQEALVRALADSPSLLSEEYANAVGLYLQRLPREVSEILLIRGLLAHLRVSPTDETLTAGLLQIYKMTPANQNIAIMLLSEIGTEQPNLSGLITQALWKDDTFRECLQEALDCKERTPEYAAQMLARVLGEPQPAVARKV